MELIGPAAGRPHTARSRNDQVATDFRLWVRDAIDEADTGIEALQRVLVARAAEHAATVMPGFTHLPGGAAGHPRPPSHGLLRDAQARPLALRRRPRAAQRVPARLGRARRYLFPVDREAVALALGFDRPTANSLDAVSDRDFALDYLAAATLCALHLSRLAEEMILWASQPFGFVRLSDSFSTGSSIMPQKRNLDAAELVRGHSGRIAGALVALATVMKGLPLAYSKDMQNDKPPVFEGHDLLVLSPAASAGMVETSTFDAERMRAAAAAGHPTATDLADWLVREAGLPFREAHHVAGRAVRLADEQNVPLWELSLGNCRRSIRGSRRAFSLSFLSTHRLRVGRASAAPRRRRSGSASRRREKCWG